jgi:hypothetical protein
MVWAIHEALEFVRMLEAHLAPVGFHATIAGSVLHKGESPNDLDVILFPHDTGSIDMPKVFEALEEAGLKPKHSRAAVARAWERQESADTKHVEVWTFGERRVDLFFLR